MAARPNILFVLADQMRGDCLGLLGHPALETPHLDAVARRGVVFTAAFSPCPSCIGARASIMTGLAPSTHGRLGYQDQVPWRYPDMLPEVLARAGYQTHCVGKTHFYPQGARFGFEGLESYEATQNFDRGYVNDYFEWLREKTGGKVKETDHGLSYNSWMSRPSHLPEEIHNNTWVAERGIEFLRRRDRTRPFFLNLSFHRPHAPLDPPQAWWDRYRDRPVAPVPVGDWAAENSVPVTDRDAWRGRLPAEALAQSRRAYWAQIAHIDGQIGRCLAALKELDSGPTFILFASDHGEMLGDHNLFRKCYAYQGSALVPLVICPPGGAEQPGRSAAPAVLQDLYPTLLEVAGAPVPSRTEGRSLLPLVAGASELPGREFVHGEHSDGYAPGTGMQFLTDGREKYVWLTRSGQEQLFDLAADPQELRDLAGDARARPRLALWRRRMVEVLASRPQDGLSDGRRLLAGRSLPDVRPELLAD